MKKEKGWVKTLDSVWSCCDKRTAQLVASELTYEDEYWQKYRGRKKPVKYTVCMIECHADGEHYFLTGFVPRVLRYCQKYNIPIEYSTDIQPMEFDEPELPGITFHTHQINALDEVLIHGRGVILNATGTGKSVVTAGIMSAFSQERILFLAHTNDLVTQMRTKHLKKYGLGPVGEWSGKVKTNKERIMVSTIQTFKNMVDDHTYSFDVVIIDETHHVNNLKSMYGYVLQRLAAPVKIGVTATLPEKKKNKMMMEALIGPVLSEFHINEAIDNGILAKPTVKILKPQRLPKQLLYDDSDIPVPDKHKKNPDYKHTSYRICYWNAIVKNVPRNMLVLHTAEEHIKKGKSVLISVVEQEHIGVLMDMAKNHYPILKMVSVDGSTPSEERERIINDMEEKKIMCTVASVVFKEGVDIKSLDVTINAAGGKSEIGVIQRLGRAIRKDKGKDTMLYIDFEDTNRYVHEHFTQRMAIYRELGWVK